MEVKNPFKPGHLSEGPIVLEQTKKVREQLSEKNRRRYSMKKMKPVVLDWGKST